MTVWFFDETFLFDYQRADEKAVMALLRRMETRLKTVRPQSDESAREMVRTWLRELRPPGYNGWFPPALMVRRMHEELRGPRSSLSAEDERNAVAELEKDQDSMVQIRPGAAEMLRLAAKASPTRVLGRTCVKSCEQRLLTDGLVEYVVATNFRPDEPFFRKCGGKGGFLVAGPDSSNVDSALAAGCQVLVLQPEAAESAARLQFVYPIPAVDAAAPE